MVRWLVLNLGLSPDGDNGDLEAGFTNSSPMERALERGRPEIVNLLFRLGAKLIDLTRLTLQIQSARMTRMQQDEFNRQRDALDQYHRWEEAMLR
jgi:hypothetical protein